MISKPLRSFIASALALVVISALSGCLKKSGEAVVLDKEHIAVAEIRPSPNEQETSPSPSPSPAAEEDGAEKPRELRPGEIEVDGYVMEKEVRGTSKDPRASDQEQWIVRVELVSDRRRVEVRARQSQYEKLKPGDRVQISYREGKYTGTVWSSEIE